MSARTLDLFNSADFRLGLLIGIAALAVAVVMALVQRSQTSMPIGGALIAVAALAALRPPPAIIIGVALLGAAGLAYPWARSVPVLPAVAALPGAYVMGNELADGPPSWLSAFVIVAIAGIAPLVSSFTVRYAQQAWGPALYAMSALGVLFAVPDTEHALVLFAITVPLAFLSWPAPIASLAPAGAYALVGLMVWVIAVDGQNREGALVGTLAVVGVLAAEPVASWFTARLLFGGVVAGWRAITVVGGFHAVVVVAAARVAAQRPDPLVAGAMASVLIALLAAAVYASQPKSRSSSV